MSFYHGRRALAATLSQRIKSEATMRALDQQVAPKIPVLQERCPAIGAYLPVCAMFTACFPA